MLSTSFSSGRLEFWYVLSREYLHDHPLIKTWHSESDELPKLDILHVLSQFSAEGIQCILEDSTEKRLLKTCTWFPLDMASSDFSLC